MRFEQRAPSIQRPRVAAAIQSSHQGRDRRLVRNHYFDRMQGACWSEETTKLSQDPVDGIIGDVVEEAVDENRVECAEP